MASSLTVSWRGQQHVLPVCYPEERAGQVTGRWPDGVIVIEELFSSSNTKSSERAIMFLINQALAAAGEKPLVIKGVHSSMFRQVAAAALKQRAEAAPELAGDE